MKGDYLSCYNCPTKLEHKSEWESEYEKGYIFEDNPLMVRCHVCGFWNPCIKEDGKWYLNIKN